MADQCVFIRGFQVKRSMFRIKPIRIGSDRVDGDRPPVRIFEVRNGGQHTSTSNTFETLALVSSSSSLATIVYPNHENPQRFQSLRTTPDPLTKGSSSSLDTTVSPNHENPQLYGFQSLHNTPDPFTRGSSSSLDTVVSPNHKEQLIQRLPAPPPPRAPEDQRNYGLRNTSSILHDDSGSSFSSSSLKPIGENPQLHPYPSSTALQSNGGLLSNASFTTSPSNDSSINRGFYAVPPPRPPSSNSSGSS